MKKEEFKKSLKKITDFQTTITQKKQKQIQKKVIKVAESPIYGKKGFYRGEILNNKLIFFILVIKELFYSSS